MFRLAEIWTGRSTASNNDDEQQGGHHRAAQRLLRALASIILARLRPTDRALPRTLRSHHCSLLLSSRRHELHLLSIIPAAFWPEEASSLAHDLRVARLTARPPLHRKFTEQELRHTLDLLNSIPRPLSPTLPPSPPASPAPPSQRRRITPETDRASTPSTDTSPAPPSRRPALTPAELARIVPLYKERAKLFKRSGDSRKRGEVRSSRLGLMELTDSVLHFAYVFWAEDRQRSRNSVYSTVEVNTWRTLEGLVSACKIGWSKDSDPAARGLYGMLILLEALVLNKMTYFHMSQIREATKGLIIQPPAQNPSPSSNLNANPNAGTTPNPNAAGTPNHPTPPSHVPSPAPTASRSPVPPAQAAQQQQAPTHRPLPEFYLPNILKHSGQYIQSQLAIANAHALLNASFMHTHFPRTHNICMTTTLGALEEAVGDAGFVRLSDDGLEVDVEACVRGEGLWAWPILSGAGMAHLVGFGRSLLWEFGSTRGGYRGADGMNVDY